MPFIDFYVKDLDMATGGPLVAVINHDDAEALDLHLGDRILLRKNSRKVVAIVDVSYNARVLPRGQIGLLEEVLKKLNVRKNSLVKLAIANKPKSVQFVKKKLEGHSLKPWEIFSIIKDVVGDELSDIELSSFVSACFVHGMSNNEIVALTNALIDTGQKIRFEKGPIMDLHSIGGVPGDRTTMIVVPIVAAAGLKIPKTSSRAITSPSGTADTMETLANVSVSLSKMKRIVNRVGGCILWGGAINLAPADDKIIRVEHPLAIDAEGQLIASVMAKKGSVGATNVVIDIPVGPNAKIKNEKNAVRLGRKFKRIGKELKMNVMTAVTDGSQPIGNGIGPALEALDVLSVLKNEPDCPKDLRAKSLFIASLLLEFGNAVKKGQGMSKSMELLESGAAYEKMKDIINAQGKAPKERLRLGRYSWDVKASSSGKIKYIDILQLSKAAKIAGAPKDYGAGIYLYRHVCDSVGKGQLLYTLYAQSLQKLNYAKEFLRENPFLKL